MLTIESAPISVIASWPKPNYINPDDRGLGLEYVCIIFASLGLVTVLARLYSRLFITKAIGVDDLLVVIALGFLTALMVLIIIANKEYYSGRHIWDVPPTSFVGSRMNIWACLWCYIISITLIKVSVLLFYRRLSVKFSKTFLIATWIGIAYNTLYFVAFALVLLLICRPLHSYWDAFNPVWAATHHFHCGNERVTLPASSGFSVLGDFYSTLLPLILVYHLELPRRQKIALYGLFTLGFAAVGAGIVRTVLMYRLLNVSYDFTWNLWFIWIWADLELYLALFAASAPSLKPFFRHFFVDPLSSFARSSTKKDPEDGNTASQNSGKGTGIKSAESTERGVSLMEITDQHKDIERNQLRGRHDLERAASQQSWYLGDQAEAGTKHFQLHNNQSGRGMRPMRVYGKPEANDYSSPLPGTAGSQDPFADPNRGGARSYCHRCLTALPAPLPPPKDWPLPATSMTSMTEEAHHRPREFLANPHLSSRYNRDI